jgi:hypothetical protein
VDLRLRGASFPEQVDRGKLHITPIDLRATHDVTLPQAGPATATVVVGAGHYRVEYEGPSPLSCDEVACGRYVVRDDLAIDADTTISFDVVPARLSGRVTLDGMPFTPTPDSNSLTGLWAHAADREWSQEIVVTDGAYGFSLAPGRYDTVFQSNMCNVGTTDRLCASEVPGCE